MPTECNAFATVNANPIKKLHLSRLRTSTVQMPISQRKSNKEIRQLYYMRTTKCGPQSQHINFRIL